MSRRKDTYLITVTSARCTASPSGPSRVTANASAIPARAVKVKSFCFEAGIGPLPFAMAAQVPVRSHVVASGFDGAGVSAAPHEVVEFDAFHETTAWWKSDQDGKWGE